MFAQVSRKYSEMHPRFASSLSSGVQIFCVRGKRRINTRRSLFDNGVRIRVICAFLPSLHISMIDRSSSMGAPLSACQAFEQIDEVTD